MFTGGVAPEKWQTKSTIVKKHKDDQANPQQPQEVAYTSSLEQVSEVFHGLTGVGLLVPAGTYKIQVLFQTDEPKQ